MVQEHSILGTLPVYRRLKWTPAGLPSCERPWGEVEPVLVHRKHLLSVGGSSASVLNDHS